MTNLLPAREPASIAPEYDESERVGFFTDTSVCIGCKACEVACKEWNEIPVDGLDFTGKSYDNTDGSAPPPGAMSPSSNSASRWPARSPGCQTTSSAG